MAFAGLAVCCNFDPAASLVRVGIASAGGAACAFAARGFFRSGLICFATLSHNSRSSLLNARLRRGGAADSGVSSGQSERFIGRRGDDGYDGGGDGSGDGVEAVADDE